MWVFCKTMKIIIGVLFFIFLLNPCFSQTASIDLELDTTIFNNRHGNIYTSDSIDADVTCMFMPFGFEKAKQGFEHESNPSIKVLDMVELDSIDRRVLFKKGELEQPNNNLIIEGYLIEYKTEQTLMVIAKYLKKDSEIIGNQIEVAIRNLKLN